MTEQHKNDNASSPQPSDQDVLGLIRKMQQQLASLEKKIDILISQPQEKSFNREGNFSKPFRSFDRPSRPGHYGDKKSYGEGSRERRPHSGHHFEKRHEEDNRGYAGRKKEYGNDREVRPGQEGYFKKKFGGNKENFGSGKKPFFQKRKDR